jgi:Skp family chaperone for outer membrane proteins
LDSKKDMKRAGHFAVVIVVTSLVSCRHKPKGEPARIVVMKPIAWVDADEVVKAMGWSRDMQYAMEGAEKNSQEALYRRYAELSQKFARAREQVVRTPLSPEQIKQLQGAMTVQEIADLPISEAERYQIVLLTSHANQEALAARQGSQNQMEHVRADLQLSYRRKVMHVAERIAAREGYRIVLAKSPDVLFHEPSIDVTGQVIGVLHRNRDSTTQPDGG